MFCLFYFVLYTYFDVYFQLIIIIYTLAVGRARVCHVTRMLLDSCIFRIRNWCRMVVIGRFRSEITICGIRDKRPKSEITICGDRNKRPKSEVTICGDGNKTSEIRNSNLRSPELKPEVRNSNLRSPAIDQSSEVGVYLSATI